MLRILIKKQIYIWIASFILAISASIAGEDFDYYKNHRASTPAHGYALDVTFDEGILSSALPACLDLPSACNYICVSTRVARMRDIIVSVLYNNLYRKDFFKLNHLEWQPEKLPKELGSKLHGWYIRALKSNDPLQAYLLFFSAACLGHRPSALKAGWLSVMNGPDIIPPITHLNELEPEVAEWQVSRLNKPITTSNAVLDVLKRVNIQDLNLYPMHAHQEQNWWLDMFIPNLDQLDSLSTEEDVKTTPEFFEAVKIEFSRPSPDIASLESRIPQHSRLKPILQLYVMPRRPEAFLERLHNLPLSDVSLGLYVDALRSYMFKLIEEGSDQAHYQHFLDLNDVSIAAALLGYKGYLHLVGILFNMLYTTDATEQDGIRKHLTQRDLDEILALNTFLLQLLLMKDQKGLDIRELSGLFLSYEIYKLDAQQHSLQQRDNDARWNALISILSADSSNIVHTRYGYD